MMGPRERAGRTHSHPEISRTRDCRKEHGPSTDGSAKHLIERLLQHLAAEEGVQRVATTQAAAEAGDEFENI